MSSPASMYERVGGTPWFVGLVDRFYAAVEQDSVLRPMYPQDLDASRANLAGFLVQYWGGPDDYSQVRGHPRLRMRHAPFAVDEDARDRWMACMSAAVRLGGLSADDETEMLEYFERAATHLINQD